MPRMLFVWSNRIVRRRCHQSLEHPEKGEEMSDTKHKLTIEIEYEIDGTISEQDAQENVWRHAADNIDGIISDPSDKWAIIIDSIARL